MPKQSAVIDGTVTSSRLTARTLRHAALAAFGSCVVSSQLACASLASFMAVPPPPPPPAPINVVYRIPRLSPQAESSPSQTKDGVSITATPVVFQKAPLDLAKSTFSDRIQLTGLDGTKQYCRTYTPIPFTSPDRLAFTVTIVNGLTRVFRSAGAVVSLNVDGKTISFDQSGIKELLDLIVIPRGQSQVTIWGPPVSVLQPRGTIGLFVFDVVTAVDAAGGATKKQNYEWYFTYDLKSEVEATPLRGNHVWVSPTGGPGQPIPGGNARIHHCP